MDESSTNHDPNAEQPQKGEPGGGDRDQAGRFKPGHNVGADTRIKPGQVLNPDGPGSPGARAQRLLRQAMRELAEEERMVKTEGTDGATIRTKMKLIDYLAASLYRLATKGNPAAIREVCNMLGSDDDGQSLAEVRLLVPKGSYLYRRLSDDDGSDGDKRQA